ncbi:MAG: flagellar hook-associated protein 3 [Alteromonadaceae bacterium]|nr:MAG: flagellar hook-associated protein 3 [Alteromonadaceae bacterium]
MRISSLQVFNIATNSMADATEAVTKTQNQLSTGQRVIRPSDDPVAATKIMQLTEELANIGQFRSNINIAKNNLELEETALTSVNNLIQRIQEVGVQAGNTATLTPNEYGALASEVEARLDELRNILNTRNANGDFIFGGYKSSGEPFSGSIDTGFSYNGDEGQQFIKIANNTTVAASDSGKAAFVDVDSVNNTIRTSVSPTNLSSPPVKISVGEVFDQAQYDSFYPQDMMITFNADTDITPPGKNYTVSERSSGRVIEEDVPYVSGNPIELNGVRIRISGGPVSGIAAVPATLEYGGNTGFDFTPPLDEAFEVTVGGRTKTFVLDRNITTPQDLEAALNDPGNGNLDSLRSLGITADTIGFSMPDGIEIRINSGSANINTVMGDIDTVVGVTSDNGELTRAGDRLFIDSTNKQDVLTTLARFAESMRNYDGSQDMRESLQDTIASTLSNLANAQTSVLEIMSTLGARFNTLESTNSFHLDTDLVTQGILSDLRDVDYAEAATRLSSQILILQAAQSSFIRVSQLSLINLL